MCSLLIFAKSDNVHPDPKLDWTKFKRGYVVDALDADDGFYYYAGDPGLFRIVVVPGVPASQFLSLIMGDPVPDTDGTPFRLRTSMVNLDTLELGQKLGTIDALPLTQPAILATVSVIAPIATVTAGPL